MALVSTTLNGAITANQDTIRLTSFTDPVVKFGQQAILAFQTGEICLIIQKITSTKLQVVRGYAGTLATSQNTGVVVIYGLISDSEWFDLLPQDAITQTPTGFFFSGNGARIDRLNDRLFVGGATANDGDYPNVTKDWLTTYQATLTPVVAPVVSSQAAILSPTSGDCGAALTTGIQSRDMGQYGAAIGIESFAVNNNTTLASLSTGFAYYGEAHRTNASASNTYVAEFQVANFGDSLVVDPYSAPSGSTFGMQVGAGCGLNGSGQVAASAAITITSNPKTFNAGLVFTDGSVGAVGPGSTISAVTMPYNYHISWFTSAATIAGGIVVDSAGKMTLSGTSVAATGGAVTMPQTTRLIPTPTTYAGNNTVTFQAFTDSSSFVRTLDIVSSGDSTGADGIIRFVTGRGTVGALASEKVRITATSAELVDGVPLVVGTSSGSKIGTATDQKLGFWNAPPVVQQVLATGTGKTVDNVISLLQTLGLCKQS